MLGASATFAEGDDVIGSPQRAEERNFRYRDVVGAALALILVVVAFVVPRLGNETITPIVHRTAESVRDFADAAPLFGFRDVHVGWGTPVAVAVAAAVVLWGPGLAQTLAWRRLTVGVGLVSALWAMALALVDGWQRGFAGRLTSTDEYLHEVPGVTDIPATLRGFADRILDLQPDSWTTHVSGHPPGALLTFVWLDRIGLDGGAWASALCVAVGSSAGAAVIVAVRALGDEAMARRAAPFLVLAPAAIWVAVSADALFAGVVAWGIALLALAATRTVPVPALVAVAAGVLLGFGVYLSYGLTLMAIPAVAVLIIARTARPLVGALAGALAVAAVFTLYGFWWFDGYQLVQDRYYQGIASDRPFAYWGWANFASLVCAVGLAVPAALPRAFAWSRVRALSPVPVLVLSALAAVVIADLSALSKAETERIWLPFEVWLLAAPALLPRGSHRFWLAVQAAGALTVNHLLFTNW
ncbi:hypothetical protein [Rhodococcus jostii]|uniref:Integral membrane protein n=1 Tax=Rhodococcus jostii TaxID=132919 RepID=A0ABU4CP06_RHOJO|nr:hypothetical protein [Rhodococcus jostii]MDV6285298.1 hypothetical protein [Rhodococcus jostii]